MKSALRHLVCFAMLLAFAPANLFAASVTATLDRTTMAVGETAVFQLRMTGASLQSIPVPSIPAQQNLTVAYAGDQNEYRIVNGVQSISRTLSYAVTATAPGTYSIPGIAIAIDGARVASQPLTITVTPAAAGAAAGIPAAFIRLNASKTNVFVGETFPIEIKVYGLIVEELNVPNLKSDGFTIGARPQGTHSRETYGNNIFNVYTFPMTVSAAKAGQLTLGPAEDQMLIRIPTQTGRRNVFEELFAGVQRKQVTVTSDPIAINVKPLPSENVPPTFNGAVGNFQVAVRASPTNVAVGDPITLSVRIQGRGSFDTLKLPDFGWKDFTFYQPNTTVTNLDPLGLTAVKNFDQVIVPQRPGITAIPALVFSYLDPETGTYHTLQRAPIPITVRATGLGQAQPTVVADQAAQAANPRPAADIVHIKPSAGTLAAFTQPLPTRPGFILLQLIPIAIWGFAIYARKRADRLANDPRLRRKIEVQRLIEKNLPELREAAAKNDSEKFFAGAFRLLQEQLGERLDLPAAAITEAVLDEKLPQHNASPELIAQLRDLFQACNQARYAGASTSSMEALIPKLESALKQIKNLGGPK